MNNNEITCNHNDLFVSGGIVRCCDCLVFFPTHKDSAPVAGVVAANQER